ncbi:MAG: mechanosensitive ion channel domain-containing protein [Rhodospirillales bacterium]
MDFKQLVDPDTMEAYFNQAVDWLNGNVFVFSTLNQLAIILAACIVAKFFEPRLRRWTEAAVAGTRIEPQARQIAVYTGPLTFPLLWLILQWFSVFMAESAALSNTLIEAVVSLLTAWVVIRLASGFIRDPFWSRTVAVIAWTIAALNIVDLLDPTIRFLDAIAFSFGNVRISVLGVMKGMIAVGVLMWAALALSRLLENRLRAIPSVTPSAQVLIGKILRITLITVAILMAISSIGIDLTALAVFTGGVGVGIGFGLQKIFANLVSGFILLMDRSLKPGDIITLGNSFGEINKLSARYVSVITRDGIETLIPNEELISTRVENWSFSDNNVRMRIPFGVSYNADIHKARELALMAADEVERVLKTPRPLCNLLEFGDSSVNFELRVWIADPINGFGNIKHQINTRLWDLFKENDIEIPFPQRDLHIRSSVPLRLDKDGGA